MGLLFVSLFFVGIYIYTHKGDSNNNNNAVSHNIYLLMM